jgi:addiction module HigA family antidote
MTAELAGRTVGEARKVLQQPLNIDPKATVYVNGEVADSERVLRDGDKLEFIKASGVKGLYGGPGPAGDLRVGAEFLEGVRRARAGPALARHGAPRIRAEARLTARTGPAASRATIRPREQDEYAVNRENITRPPVHPGVFFERNILPEFLRQRRAIGEIAKLLGVSRQTLHRVMAGRSSVTPEMAVRLGKLCGNGPGLWLSLQARYDGWEATERLGEELKNIPTLRDWYVS